MADYWQELPDEGAAGVVLLLPGRRRDEGRQGQLFVDAGRVLMLCGCSALLAVVSALGNSCAAARRLLDMLLFDCI